MEKLINITGKALSGEWGIDDEEGIGIPVLRTTNFTNDGIIDYSNVITRTITKKNIADKFLRKGDIIIEKSGGSDNKPVGRVVYFDNDENKYLFNNFTGLLRVKDTTKWLPKYIFYSLFANYQSGGTRRYENKTTGLHNLQTDFYVKDFEIKEISYGEQIEICELFDGITDLIDKRKRQLEKLDELVKSRFIEMFGDPVVNPKSWETAPLSTLIINANNGMARRGKDEDGSIVLRLVELQNGFIDYSTPNRICLNETEKKRYELVDNDFLFARVNGNPDYVGRCAVFKSIDEPVFHNDHIIRVHFDETKINGFFMSVLLNSDYGKRQMREQIKTSAGQYTISQDGIGAIMAILPPLELQEQFAAFVKQVDKSKFEIKQSLEKLELLKKSLMQKYFG